MGDLNIGTRASIGAVTGPAALLVALIAMVSSLSGGAAAAPHSHKITARQLAKGAVTARALAPGAVNSKALADNAVNKRIIAPGAVIARGISADAVTRDAIAPGSVYGGALTTESIHVTPIADRDAIAANPEWTASNTETTLCGPGEALLGTGFIVNEPGNREVTFLRAAPFLSGTGNGVTGEIASNSGGVAKAQIMAICLGG
ncbi:MAG: hypothetical protein JSU06_16510 [Actinobacteria bacterium]|nr:hypothetical protein [Actinomycetota bacterium]